MVHVQGTGRNKFGTRAQQNVGQPVKLLNIADCSAKLHSVQCSTHFMSICNVAMTTTCICYCDLLFVARDLNKMSFFKLTHDLKETFTQWHMTLVDFSILLSLMSEGMMFVSVTSHTRNSEELHRK